MGRPFLPDSPKRKYRVEYYTWQNMLRRCEGKGRSGPAYIAKGITVCERWRLSFAAFLEDMGTRPAGPPRAWSIERLKNDGNYEPGNCVWASPKQQARNRRNWRRSE